MEEVGLICSAENNQLNPINNTNNCDNVNTTKNKQNRKLKLPKGPFPCKYCGEMLISFFFLVFTHK